MDRRQFLRASGEGLAALAVLNTACVQGLPAGLTIPSATGDITAGSDTDSSQSTSTTGTTPNPANGSGTYGYVGEVRMWAPSFEPLGWMYCQGQELRIRDYPALYSVIGNTFGGGIQTFKLPNLCGRVPIGAGVPAGGAAEIKVGATGISTAAGNNGLTQLALNFIICVWGDVPIAG